MHDVVVIGCGPAGLMAARELEKAGINFIGLEIRKKIGEPLKCGEGIRKSDFVEIFKNTDHDFILNEANKHRMICGKERVFYEPFLEMDKPAFERWLAKPVIKKIKLSTACRGIEHKENCVEINTNKGRVRARLAIISTGPHFTLQKKLKMTDKTPSMIPGYGGVYKNIKTYENSFYFYLNTKDMGYFWVFPKGNGQANIGYGSLRGNIKGEFNRRMKKYGLSKLKPERELGGMIPLGGPIKKTYSERALAAGSSAGFVQAGTGEGNYFALKSGIIAGKLAARAIKTNNVNQKFLSNYEKEWKKAFGDRLETGIALSNIEMAGVKFGLIEKFLEIVSEKNLRQVVLGKTSLAVKILVVLIKRFNLLSPGVTKDSLRFKLLVSIYRALHKMRAV